jgi:RNA polymerase primary sigma factor
MNYEKQTINKKYYQDLSKFDTLTQEQIKDLYILIKQDDKEAIDELITSNLKLVIHFAKNYRSMLHKAEAIELDDLISEGNIGLIKAIKNYNPDLNIKFSYYAGFWIKKAISELFINEGCTIRSPQGKIISDNKIAKVVEDLFQKNQYEVFQNDIEELNQFKQSEINHFFYSKPNVNRFDETYDLKDVEDDEESEDKIKLRYNLKCLTPQERTVIDLYFGFENGEKMILKDIGIRLGLTKARINQIKENALNKLKNKML